MIRVLEKGTEINFDKLENFLISAWLDEKWEYIRRYKKTNPHQLDYRAKALTFCLRKKKVKT